MTISANVRKELFEMTANEGKLIRIKPTEAKAGTTVYSSKQAQPLKMWTQEEHEKFLEAMEKYPAGPWKVIAAFIGTKTTRQTMTHAQKYRQKIGRWRRGLRHKGRKQAGDAAGDAAAAADAAKDSLFKAIDYVSSDEMSCYGGNDASPARSAAGSVNDERSELFRLAELASIEGMKQEPPASPPYQLPQQQPQHQHFQPQVFGPSQAGMVVVPSSPADVEMADMSARIQIKQESVEYDNYHFKLKQQMEWGHGENAWRGRGHAPEIKLSPLRGVSGVEGRVLSAISGMSFLNAQHQVPLPLPASRAPSPERDMSDDECSTRAFRSASGAFRLPPLNIAAQSAPAFAIPPLRTKVDPSMLHFAPMH